MGGQKGGFGVKKGDLGSKRGIWGQKGGFGVKKGDLGSGVLTIFIPLVPRCPNCWWRVSEPLLLKYESLGFFPGQKGGFGVKKGDLESKRGIWGQKGGFGVLGAYHFDTFACRLYQDFLIVGINPLIYGFH